MSNIKISAYISGHGFGHISRSLEALSNILLLRPDWSVRIISPRGEEFARSLDDKGLWGRVKDRFSFESEKPDVGIIQRDSLGMDLEATKSEIEIFRKNKESFLDKQTKSLRAETPDLIWSDSSSLPFCLSSSLHIPSLFLGNFTWDFIYSKYEDPIFRSFSQELKEEYENCDLGLVLPLSCPITSIRNTREIGLLGRKPNLDKESARRYYGFEEGIQYYLFSFGAYGIDPTQFDWKNWDPSKKRIVVGGVEWKGENHLGLVSIPKCHYPDLLRACDFVLTKPGYGILSEAYFAGTPVLYTDRGDFPEYPYLVKELGSKFNSAYISHNNIYSFHWDPSSRKAIENQPKPDPRFEKNAIYDILNFIEELIS
ncbi:glycosyl transferase [Leptospira langatensis]|uniref:Glycosyl transferase n=1 Tax=Leptospira langatensis TaxID=2484983 RepID=A0A5F1ZNU7_9LEPT|nr:glycosyl transferase [Leptospira langatensis]TGK05185.1 glycosyl transferase [Leptospira langatensis]TGL38321.1 glycosyl transferase [Leptospira langatensis]